jgi:hypothetical protein
MSFLVTALGRSGTKWLAKLLDRSPTWCVAHEARPIGQMKLDVMRQRLSEPNYGEVSAPMRPYASQVEVDVGKVIIRHPYDQVVSAYNRAIVVCRQPPDYLASMVGEAYRELFRLVDRLGWGVILFDRMISEVEYTQQVAAELGVTDVTVTEEDLATKEHAFPQAITSFNALPEVARRVTIDGAAPVLRRFPHLIRRY